MFGTIVMGSIIVSTPPFCTPSEEAIGTRILLSSILHNVSGSTAPSNRHLKHVRTPLSTRVLLLSEVVNVSMHCELPVG